MKGFDPEDGSCACGGHAVQRMNPKTQRLFYGCSNYPQCRITASDRSGGGDLFLSRQARDEAFYDAFYEGDGK